jgi:hypothetical protein
MEALLEERLHRAGRQVAAADQPLISLKDCGNVKGSRWPEGFSSRTSWQWLLSSLSALGGARGRLQLPRLLRSFVGLQAARRMEELAGAGSVARGALGLNGCWSERTCQAAISTLRATAALAGLDLPWRRLMSV